MSKRYHYFYIIVNKVNRKFYYGVHSTNNLNDGYMGSGVTLDAAKKKYGIENFKKTILGFFDTRDELLAVEREFVNPEFLEAHKDECYNCRPGGEGGCSPEVAVKISETRSGHVYHSPETRKKQSDAHKGQIPWNKGLKGVQVAWNKGKPASEETKRKVSEKNKGKPAWNKGKPSPFKGRKHSPETIEKIKESNKRRWATKKAAQANSDICSN